MSDHADAEPAQPRTGHDVSSSVSTPRRALPNGGRHGTPDAEPRGSTRDVAAPEGARGARGVPGTADARLEETAHELARLDPHLAGLFRFGHALLHRLAEPGVVYLVAHCGRELANGVVRALTPDVPELLDGERAALPERADGVANVARVLGERPGHPSVARWVEVARALQSHAHVRVSGNDGDAPAPAAVRADFLALGDLLYGRIAPFFAAQADLEALARVPAPGPADLARLRPLLLRPVQRRRFFGELAHAGWLPLLRDGGFLAAPALVTGSDGQRRARPWVEGRYLERVAPEAPAAVRDVLAAVPRANDNPLVWRTVADAARALPVSEARTLVGPLLRAVRIPHVAAWCAHSLVTLAGRLAVAGAEEAFALVEALLWLVREPPPPGAAPPPSGVAARLAAGADPGGASLGAAARRMAARRTQSTGWMFARLDAYEFTRVLEGPVPALERMDGLRTLRLLTARLAHAVRLGVVADAEDDAREAREEAAEQEVGAGADRDAPDAVHEGGETAGATESPQGAEPSDTPPHLARRADVGGPVFGGTMADDSRWWAERIDQPGPHSDVRHQLAATATAVAGRLAAAGPGAAAEADEALRALRWDVFARMRLLVLAGAGANAPRAVLDAVLDSPDVLEPPYGAREVATFLRAQFTRASAEAQIRYATRLRDGPPPDELARLVEHDRWWRAQGGANVEEGADGVDTAGTWEAEDAGEADAEAARTEDATLAAEVRAEWQRRRLRFFHADIPPVLHELARALDVTARVPSAREQAMDEVGSWSSGVVSRGWRSPVGADALAGLPVDAVLAQLAEWPASAERGTRPRWDAETAPSRTGLLRALSDAVGHAPPWGAELAAGMAARLAADQPWAAVEDMADHVTALLHGFTLRNAALAPACWPGVRDLARAVWRDSPPNALPAAAGGDHPDSDGEGDTRTGDAAWREAAEAAVDAMRRFADNEALPPDAGAEVWATLGDAVRSAWLRAHPGRRGSARARHGAGAAADAGEGADALERLTERARGSAAGRLFRAAMACADWHLYVAAPDDSSGHAHRARRRHVGRSTIPSDERRRQVAARVCRFLTAWLGAADTTEAERRHAELLLGTELAFLHWLAGRWVRRRVLPRLGTGATPVGAPAWGAYLTRGHVTRALFGRLRDLYLTAAAHDASRPRRAGAQFDSIGNGLAFHAVEAVLTGAVGLRHPSDVVARAFGAVDGRDRGRVYWQLFRGASDTPGGPTPQFVRRLLAFWAWRLTILEADAASATSDRNAAAADEASEMLWLLATPGLAPADTVLNLGGRTARLARGRGHASGAVWDRLAPLADAWPAETFAVLEALVDPELRDHAPHLPVEPVSAVLRAALRHTPDVHARARRLVDRFGEHDEFAFRPLLTEHPVENSGEGSADR